MAFRRLELSEHSSGRRQRQGGITLTGNSHARRMLVESAWSYRFPARQTKHPRSKAANASPEAKGVAWKAQVRLCGHYRSMTRADKNTKPVCVAIARELAGHAIPAFKNGQIRDRGARTMAALTPSGSNLTGMVTMSVWIVPSHRPKLDSRG